MDDHLASGRARRDIWGGAGLASKRVLSGCARLAAAMVLVGGALAVGTAGAQAATIDHVRNFGDTSTFSLSLPVIDSADQRIFLVKGPHYLKSRWNGELAVLDFTGRIVKIIHFDAPVHGAAVLGPDDRLYLVTGSTLSVFDARTMRKLATVATPADVAGPSLAGSRIWLLNRSVDFHDYNGVYSTPLDKPGHWTYSTGANKLDVSGTDRFMPGGTAASPYLGYLSVTFGMLHVHGAVPTEERSDVNSGNYDGVYFSPEPTAASRNGGGYVALPVEFDLGPPKVYGAVLYKPSDLKKPVGEVTESASGVGAITMSPNGHTVVESVYAGTQEYVVQRWTSPSKLAVLKKFSRDTTLDPPLVTPDGKTMIYLEIHNVDTSTGSQFDEYLHIDHVHINDWSS
jgi:hypothetical protein